ncbi:MAG TPA: hypothetical protein VKE41_00065 [Roseiflexaceae bacterium]|nr:hypothetical protein [Roseiflexaceae bacterium]
MRIVTGLGAGLSLQSPVDQVCDDRDIATTRAQLDDATFAAAWAEGRAMTLEQAIAYALEVDAIGM